MDTEPWESSSGSENSLSGECAGALYVDSWESPRTENEENCLATLGMHLCWRLIPRFCVVFCASLTVSKRDQFSLEKSIKTNKNSWNIETSR